MDGFYLGAFERRFPAIQDYAPVGALLGVLRVGREPMSRAELAAVLCMTEAHIQAYQLSTSALTASQPRSDFTVAGEKRCDSDK